MGSPVTLSHLALSDIERSLSRSLKYQRFISRKAAELGHMLLLKINRKQWDELLSLSLTSARSVR